MKITKSKLLQIIKEELEAGRKSELKTFVLDLADKYDGVMQSVGETLPRWLQTDEPLNSIVKKFPDLKNLEPAAFKDALGIETIGPDGEAI